MASKYPLCHYDYRRLPSDYSGRAFVWDVDKTYLSTRFSSAKGLLRIPIEFGIDKVAIPGMPAVLRGLRHGEGDSYAGHPLYFVSASPPQLRRVLERKMLLDGVEHDGLIFKDWMGSLKALRPGRLREQLGFKVCALLTGRVQRPGATEYLFGDDVECDAEAFGVYARLLGEEAGGLVDDLLAAKGVAADDRRCIAALLQQLPQKRGQVGRIFIHREHRTPVETLASHHPCVVPVLGAFQLGLALRGLGLIRPKAVLQAKQAWESGANESPAHLLDEALSRGLLGESDAEIFRD